MLFDTPGVTVPDSVMAPPTNGPTKRKRKASDDAPAPPSQIENVDVNELHYVRLNCCRIYLTIPTLIIFFNLTGAQVRLRAQDRSRGGGEGCCRRRRPGRGLILSRGSH